MDFRRFDILVLPGLVVTGTPLLFVEAVVSVIWYLGMSSWVQTERCLFRCSPEYRTSSSFGSSHTFKLVFLPLLYLCHIPVYRSWDSVASCTIPVLATLEDEMLVSKSDGKAQVPGCRHWRLELESAGIRWSGIQLVVHHGYRTFSYE